MNGGCDLEAIAAEEVPYTTTTSSSTTAPPLTTTSSTTEAPLNCTLTGLARGSNTPTTTTTSTTSTTSTTTTICPNCKTYTIENSTGDVQRTDYTDCKTGQATYVNNDLQIMHVCSCTLPTSEGDVTITEFNSKCIECFCFEVTNTSSTLATEVQYLNCSGVFVYKNLNPSEVVNICVKNHQVQGSNISIVEGVSSCTVNGDCSPTTTTTTTSAPGYRWIANVGSDDLFHATGNTDPRYDDKVFISYVDNITSLTVIESYNTIGPQHPICALPATTPFMYFYENDIEINPKDSTLTQTTNC